MTKGEKRAMFRDLKAKRRRYFVEMNASTTKNDREFYKELFELSDKQIAQLGMA